MKKLLSLVLVATLSLLCAFSLFGCDNQSDKLKSKGFVCKTEEGKYIVYSYVDEGNGVTELDIQEAVRKQYNDNDAVVVKIKANAFNGNDTLTKVVVPTTVEEIEAGAFKNMKKLKEITLPFVGQYAKADADIGQTGASENKAVDSARIFSHIFGKDEYVGGSKMVTYFNETDSGSVTVYVPMTLRIINIVPASEYTIPAYAFAGLTLVDQVNFGENVSKELGKGAFYNSSLEIPEGYTEVK